MFYRWAKRLESLPFPATAFPAAGGDPAADTEEAHELDAALVAATIASLWVLLQTVRSASFVAPDWAIVTFAPIALVVVLGALFVRAPAPRGLIAVHLGAYGGLAVLVAAVWATSGFAVMVWAAFFALLGLVTTVFCLVVWSEVLRELATPGALLYSHARGLRALCMMVILLTVYSATSKAIVIPLGGLR